MDDVRAIMDAVGSERAALLGYSEGASMSALFATTYPDRTAALVMYGSYLTWDWMAAGRFRSRHESVRAALDEIERRWGTPDYCDELLENDAPSMLGDERFRQWYATRLRLSASPRAAVDLQRMNIDGKFGGIAVVTGARIAGLGNVGEILVSSTVRDLVAGSGIVFDERASASSRACPTAVRSTRSSTRRATPRRWPVPPRSASGRHGLARPLTRPSAQRRHEDVPLARAVELAEEDALPATETELAAVDRDEHLRADQRAAHVRGGVRAVGVLDVLPRPAVVDDLLKGGLEVAGDQRVSALVDRHTRRRVRDVDECGRRAVRIRERVLHQRGDVDQLGLPVGSDGDPPHAGILGDPG
jgi:pimeloyl-ACP methyl ester carboxylesterase